MSDPIKMDIVWMIEGDKVTRSQIFLYNSANHSEARLDWFNVPEGSFELYAGEAPSGPRFSIYLVDQIKNIEECSQKSLLPTKHILKINYYNPAKVPLKIAFQQKEDLKSWIESLKKTLDLGKKHRKKLEKEHRINIKASDPNDYSDEGCYVTTDVGNTIAFDVDVDSTAASQRNGVVGDGTIIISNNHVTLLCRANNYIISWHYKHVRRFGYAATSFLLEGGHKSGPKGEGLFIFSNCQGHNIRECIKDKTSALAASSVMSDGNESDSGVYTEDTIDKLYSEVKKIHGKLNGKSNEIVSTQPLEVYFSAMKNDLEDQNAQSKPTPEVQSKPLVLPQKPSVPSQKPLVPSQKPFVPPEKPPHMSQLKKDIVREKRDTISKMSDVLEILSLRTDDKNLENPEEYSALSFHSTNPSQTDVTGNLYGEALCQQNGLEQNTYYNSDSAYSQVDYYGNVANNKKSKTTKK